MVLVGRTGAGKSSSGNTILGSRVFRAAKSGSSVTKECWKESGEVAGREITLVDTPGLFDTDLSEQELKQEISKCINMTAPGPHAIVLVIQLGPFTQEEHMSVEKIRAIFGEDADKNTMVLFTRGDELDSTIEEYISSAPKGLKDLIERCGGRYHVFDNTAMQEHTQVLKFLEKVDDLVSSNGGEFYTNKMYQDVEHMLKTKVEELRNFYEQKMQEKETELEMQFQEEKKILQETIDALREAGKEKEKKIRELERLNKLKMSQLTENKCYYEAKLREVRMEAEQSRVSEQVLNQILGCFQSISI